MNRKYIALYVRKIRDSKGRVKVFKGTPGDSRLWCGQESVPVKIIEVKK